MVDAVADKVVVELDARTTRYLGNLRRSRTEFTRTMEAMGMSAYRMERLVTSSGRRMAFGMNHAIAAIAVAGAVKQAQVLADTWTQTGNKLAAAGVAAEDLGARQRQLVELAQATRSEYGQTADILARVTRSTEELNATDYQRLRVTELINKAVKAGGATTAEQISTITQLGQALASGNLQGDELRSIRENSPLIARAIAKEFDTTIGGLKALGKEGVLTSDRVFSAILKYGSAIDDQFSKTRSTIGESFTYLENAAIQFLGNFDKAVGVSTGIAEFTRAVADDFDLMAQAVIVAAALVGGAIVGKMTVPLQSAAVANARFVANLLSGRAAFQLEAEAARSNAQQILNKARADQDAARASVVATQTRIRQLQEEAAAYATNIRLAEQQRAAVAGIASGRHNGQFVSGADQAAATEARNQATRAAIANRLQLKRVTDELTAAEARLVVQHNALSGALARVAGAQRAVTTAMSAGVVVARVASTAMKGLGVAMSWFGGPVGLAIMAVAGALAYLSVEAAKAEAAGDNLRATLDEIDQSAEDTAAEVDNLTGRQKEGAAASNTAANNARDSASAYDAVAVAAANAAEYVKYLTAAQRQQRLEKLDEQIGDLRDAQRAQGPFTGIFSTNNQERIDNAKKRLFEEAGLPGGSAAYDRGMLTQRAWEASRQANASEDLKEAAQEYANAVAVFNDNEQALTRAVAARNVIFESIDDPTLERPSPNTSNIVPPTGAGGDRGGSSGGRRGRASREETREELEARREMAELERRLALQREAGAESLAQFTQDEITRRKLIAELIDEQYSPNQAEQMANEHIRELRTARELAAEAERAEEAREKADEQRQKDEEARQTRLEQIAFIEEQDLLLQRELARLAGDSARVEELDKIIDRLEHIRDLVERGGMTPEAAADKATRDQEAIDRAEDEGDIRSWVSEPLKAALLEAFEDGDWGQAFADTIETKASEALGRAFDDLFAIISDQLTAVFRDAAKSSGGFDWGSILSSIGGWFGGKKAAGGTNFGSGEFVKVGENGPEYVSFDRAGRVLPNRTENSTGSASVNIGLSVINATGVPAKATMERDDQGNTRIRLEPLMDEAIMSAGRRGVVSKAQKSSPAPKRRV